MAFFAGNYTIKVIHWIIQPGPGGELWSVESSAPQAPIDVSTPSSPVIEFHNQFPAATPQNVYITYAEAYADALALLNKVKAIAIEVIEYDLTQ